MSIRLRSALLVVATAISVPASAAPFTPRLPHVGGAIMAVAYSTTVRDIQQELNGRGYNAGAVDGLMGSGTRSAIEAYERASGLLVTGQPSQSLLDHLRSQGARPAADTGQDGDQRLMRLQRSLDRLGYAVEANGRLDVQTREAIRKYERDKNLLVTGEASEPLMEHVRGSLRTAGSGRRDDGDTALDAATIARIQVGLRQRGYTVGNVSGDLDNPTRDAIRAYQSDRGVTATGEPSAELDTQLAEGLAGSVNTRENIRAVQAALNGRGYTAGPADGVMGPSTRNAIQAYRQKAGLDVSSDVTQSLLTSLGLAAPAMPLAVKEPGSVDSRANIVLRDGFDDGNHDANPRWQVLAQEFQVLGGALKSSVGVGPETQADRGKAVFEGLLGEVLGVQLARQGNAAAIAHATGFPNDFNLQVKIRETGSQPVRMHIGPYSGGNAVNGYRLMYDSQASQPLTIVAATESGTKRIASTSQAPKLDDGLWHQVMFSHRPDGRIVVEIDDAVVLETSDQSIVARQDGVSFVNAGGDWEIDMIEVQAPNPEQRRRMQRSDNR